MKVRGKRFLLNPPGFHSVGAIVAEVSNTSQRKPGCDAAGKELQGPWSAEPEYTMLMVSDCSRAVELSLDWETAAGRRASLYKVDRMIEALTSFRDGLVAEQALYVERVKHLPKEP